MNALDMLVKNWIAKAESDIKIAVDELNTEEPASDAICFHAQQCSEKYLKAYLVFKGIDFKKTHSIAKLIELCKVASGDFDMLYSINADILTNYAVEVRYADDFYFPSVGEAREAVDIARKVREFVRKKLVDEGFRL